MQHAPARDDRDGPDVSWSRFQVGPNSSPKNRTALIIGGSLAGQLAAAALARHGFSVTILDRDQLPDAALPRKGLAQSRHLHGLMIGGQRSLETLLPGSSPVLSLSVRSG